VRRRSLWWLLLPGACSLAPWVFWAAAVVPYRGNDPEGPLIGAGLLGIGSLALTGLSHPYSYSLAKEPKISRCPLS